MKRFLLILAMILGTVSSWGQNLNTDYVVVDLTAPNLAQLQSQYNGQPHVLMNESMKPAPYMIYMVMNDNGQQTVDLHIFVATQPGVLNFKSGSVNLANVASFSKEFSNWKNNVRGKVVIHSTNVFNTADGIALKTKLQELTGLDFITP